MAMIARYLVIMGAVLFGFVNFVACGANLYTVNMEDDIAEQEKFSEGRNPASSRYGLHAVKGWNEKPIPVKISAELTADQRRGLEEAMKTWELAVGKKLFRIVGTEQKSGDEFDGDSDPEPSITDYQTVGSFNGDFVNGNYLRSNWDSMGKSPNVLATTAYVKQGDELIVTSDIIYNTQHFDIGDNLEGSSEVDMRTLAIHELGHFLGLTHNREESSVMYPMVKIGMGIYRRYLSEFDVELVHKIYGCHYDPCSVEEITDKIAVYAGAQFGSDQLNEQDELDEEPTAAPITQSPQSGTGEPGPLETTEAH